MKTRFDVVVIGSGPGGYHAAIRSAQLGKSVACIDRGGLGGVCVNVGCIPTKALLHVGETARAAREAGALGLRIGDVGVDVPSVRGFAERVVRSNVDGLVSLFRGNGVEHVVGEARLVGPSEARGDGGSHAVAVTGPSGTHTLSAGAIVIATGSEPTPLPSIPRDGRVVLDSTDALALAEIPPRFLVVGGGVVGLELATIYARLGSRVTVVERAPEILAGVDLEIARTLRRALVKQGIEILVDTETTLRDARGPASVELRALSGGAPDVRDVDKILVAVGRRPVTRGLDLQAVGLATDARGFLVVDAQRRTTVPGIFAVGDVTGGPLLAHKAMREGVVAAEAIDRDRGAAYDPIAVPNCVYTDPQLASVGLGEEAARAAGYAVRIGKFPLVASGRARTMNAAEGLVKLVSDERTDLLLGVHVVGPHAESLIGEGVIALEMRATTEDLALSIHPHPTLTEAIHDAAESAHGKAIHLLNRKPKAP